MKTRVLVVDGQEREDGNLRHLASQLVIGQKITAAYRYFLFGNPKAKCDIRFTLERDGEDSAVLEHLRETHQFKLQAA